MSHFSFIKEMEKMVLQNEQLMEFKSRIMEAQSALQKEVNPNVK